MIVNPQNQNKLPKNKNKGRDLASDVASGWEQKRLINKKALQEIEVARMRKIQDIYQREVNYEIPPHLEFIKKHYEALGIKGFAYYTAKIKVQEGDFEKKKWLNIMKDSDGFFKYEAQQIVKIVCEFQVIKKSRVVGAGYKTDPENLFCEELKVWATNTLCMLECSTNTKELINKRCRYLEEVLCEDGLFDRPSSLITHTIQQVIVACRGVLRYRAIPLIDREIAHHDARRAFDSIKKHLVMIMSDTLEFASNVFRTSKGKQVNPADKVGTLLGAVMCSENVAMAFPNDQAEIRDKIYAPGVHGALSKPRSVLVLGAQDELQLAEFHTPPIKVKKTEPPIEKEGNMVKLNQKHLAKLFVGGDSGFEEKFRGNPQIAKQYLKTLALILEVGDFYSLVDKAAACASKGGTLLVYGLANAQLNVMLETCEHLMGSLREACSTLSRIAELRFEELVFQNNATTSRNPWIMYYRTIHSTLSRIDKSLASVSQEVALIKVQANSLTLYEMFQEASAETDTFLTAATDFASHMSSVLGVTYKAIDKTDKMVSLPDIKELKSICDGTNPQKFHSREKEMLAITDGSDTQDVFIIVPEKEKEKEMVAATPERFSKKKNHSEKKRRITLFAKPKPDFHKELDSSDDGLGGGDEDSSVRFSEDSSVMSTPNLSRKSSTQNLPPPGSARKSLNAPIEPLIEKAIVPETPKGRATVSSLPAQITVPVKIDEFVLNGREMSPADLGNVKEGINSRVKRVELVDDKITGPMFVDLYKHLEAFCLSSLTILNVANNNIGDVGAKAFGDYLIEPECALMSLTLSHNGITDKGGICLLQSLAENKSLQLLNLDYNELTDISLIEIEKSLSANPGCPMLHLSLAEPPEKRLYTKTGGKLLLKLMNNRTKLAITGDPPFTLEESAGDQTPKNKSKLLKAQKMISKADIDPFPKIAMLSLTRLRTMSIND
eukprot:TRINITY_DN4260_c0_g1_i1.p1 TRINITY_DN4260_c0_g1~~TRINITY_DN4260_c0_g1_i1.p1  ORF type:complete len:949 (-),score=275.18 TRINITY_DN4260_c0_g1_i1:43-2889(-)